MTKPAQAVVPLYPESRIEFHELVVRREPGREPLVGCPKVRRYLEMDEEGVAVLEAIRAAGSVRAAEEKLRASSEDEFDLLEFVGILRSKGFVRSIDGVELKVEEDDARARHPFLHAIDPDRLRWLHSPWLLASILLAIGAWFALLYADPSLRPRFEHMILTRRPAANIALTLASLFAIAYVHELAHFFVARSFGIDATIKLSHRFYMIVLQTDVTNAWTLGRRQRLAIFLAGIAFNLTAASVAAFFLAAASYGVWDASPAMQATLRFFIYLNVFPLSFQLFLPARTDLYHVLLVATGERNLLGDSLGYLKFRARRAWAMLRGQPRSACPECTGPILAEDPFCLRCGLRQEVADPNRHAFPARARRWLPFTGVFFLSGMLLGYGYFFAVVSRYMTFHVVTSVSQFGLAVDDGRLGLAIEGMLALVLGVLQMALAGFFLVKGVYGMTLEQPLSWAQRRTLRRVLPRIDASRHSRIVGVCMRAFPRNVTHFERVRTTFSLVGFASLSPGTAGPLQET